MELRSCDHIHFIQAVKSGLVFKSLNVSCGRPTLKLKTLTEIYETSDATKCDFLLTPKNEVGQLLYSNNTAKVESPNMRYAVKRKVKVEPDTSECMVDVDVESNNDLEDLCFGNMTLKQIKDKCKTKKRKLSKCIDFSKETSGTFSPAKEDCFDMEADKGECDLMEPLIRLKSKVSKKGKAKGKHLKKDVSSPYQTAVSAIKSEEVAGLEDLVNSSMHVRIKCEAPEPTRSEIEYKNCFDGDLSLVCINQMGSCGIGLQEVSELDAEHAIGIGISSPFSEEPHCCVFNEPYDSVPLSEGPQCCLLNESYDLIPLSEKPEWCFLNESYHDIMEYADPEPLQVVNTLLEDSKDVDGLEITSSQCSDSPELETKMDGYLTYSVDAEIFKELVFSADYHHSNMCSNFKTIKSEDKILHQIERNAEIQLPDVVVQNCLQHKGSGLGSCASASVDDATVDLHVGDSSLSLDCILVSSADDSPLTKGKQPQKPVCADAEKNCCPEILYHDAANGLKSLFDAGYDHYSKSKHPERLFQSRKSISPESQEKLCKVMESVELDKEAYHISGCSKKLIFGKHIENSTEINGDEEPDLAIDSEQIIMKSETEKKLSHPKGSSKASQISTGCTSSCSKSAIAFSQRQMQDIESLATKLTSELKTMKEIAEERLLSAACPNTSLRYNTNKVRMAIKNATRAEQSAKKWLYMMSRDCNRFCKIMRLTDKSPKFSESSINQESATIVNKEKRKISFADEAGEKLCHVRYFENELTSLMESDNGKPEVQA